MNKKTSVLLSFIGLFLILAIISGLIMLGCSTKDPLHPSTPPTADDGHTNGNGDTGTEGSVGLDASGYITTNAVATITVNDVDLVDPTVDVKVISDTDPTGITNTLNFISAGKYEGTVGFTTGTSGSGKIQVSHNDTVTVVYWDENPKGNRYDTAIWEASCSLDVASVTNAAKSYHGIYSDTWGNDAGSGAATWDVWNSGFTYQEIIGCAEIDPADGLNAMEITKTAVLGQMVYWFNQNATGAANFKDGIFRMWVKSDNVTWMQLFIKDIRTTPETNQISLGFNPSVPEAGEWYEIWVDLQDPVNNHSTGHGETGSIDGNGTPVDKLEYIFFMQHAPTTAGTKFIIDCMHFEY